MKRLFLALALPCTIGIAETNKSSAPVIGVQHYFIEDESSRLLAQVLQSLRYLKSLK